jgi:hypothetical protein
MAKTPVKAEKRKAEGEPTGPAGPSKKSAKVAGRVHPSRVRKLNDADVKNGPVIYW